MLNKLSWHMNKLSGKIPELSNLNDKIDILQTRLEKAENGIHDGFFGDARLYSQQEFDTDSKNGKNYIKYVKDRLQTTLQERDFFYPESSTEQAQTPHLPSETRHSAETQTIISPP